MSWQKGRWRLFHHLRFYTDFGKLGKESLSFQDGRSKMKRLEYVGFF